MASAWAPQSRLNKCGKTQYVFLSATAYKGAIIADLKNDIGIAMSLVCGDAAKRSIMTPLIIGEFRRGIFEISRFDSSLDPKYLLFPFITI
jgi:hypothetical protein